MTARRLAVWFGGILLLALVSRARLDENSSGRCRLDGNRLVPVYEVDLMRDGQVLKRFCCVRCAREWPEVHEGEYWQVRDEVSGEVLDATRAIFVESTVVTIPSRQDRTHVFRHRRHAMDHVHEYDGRPIPNPLVGRRPPSPADGDPTSRGND